MLHAGCDALSVHLILTVIAATLSIGISWKAVVGSLGIMIPWQLAHWEEYHTGLPRHAACYSCAAAGCRHAAMRHAGLLWVVDGWPPCWAGGPTLICAHILACPCCSTA